MKLMRWQPSSPSSISVLHDEFDRWIDRVFGQEFFAPASAQSPQSSGGPSAFAPPVNVVDRGDAIEVTAEIPGMEPDDIKLTCENEVLLITGEKKHEAKTEKDNVYRYECRYGSFRRAVELPSEVNAEKAEASFKNGVLFVKLPKVEIAKPKVVKIKVH